VELAAPAPAQHFTSIVVATPAHIAGRLLAAVDRDLAALLEIPAASAAILLLGCRRDQIAHAMDGFGFVAPLCEQRRILSASFSSVKFPGRAPPGKVLLRVFVGGACQAELVELDNDQLLQLALQELRDLIGLRGDPELVRIVRWRHAMPQYHLGHLQRVQSIEQALRRLPGLELAGNAYRGVGIPFCIRSGEDAAQRLLG
jgi:oxygen-dependent protoporphyrinogen oxidase